jgi:hypothetical protein
MAIATEIRDEGLWSVASHSQDEDYTESTFAKIVSVSIELHPTNFGAIEHANGLICYNTVTCQPSTVMEGLLETWSGGG